ncbi:zinc finger and SCAN domain-containing protein 2-like [Gouania willdenowi]|uniref:zinc finger and SCAN domain-containing protein 2-like n=1 Tax=Gouania willdenowi TaxID=441366 RepID=UPI001055A5C4|nr:zinc finger and SCAN domain-containing protein 2-like [Gouania willdenowi]
MSKREIFSATVKELLDKAAEEIFTLFERTVAEYEEKLSQCKRTDCGHHHQHDTVPPLKSGALQTSAVKEVQCDQSSALNQQDLAFCRIKQETEEVQRSFPLLASPVDVGRRSTSTETEVRVDEDESLSESGSEIKDEEEVDYENGLNYLPGFESKAERFGTNSLYDESRELGGNLGLKKVGETQTITDDGKKLYICDVCGQGFSRRGNLRTHMGVHTGEKPFQCQHCGKRFRHPSNFRRHTRVHSGEKPFSCGVCSKRFSEQMSLQSHMNTHVGETRFGCHFCDKTFNRKSYLKTHMLVHGGEKPFGCSVCGRRFTRKGDLKRHMLVHTVEKMED